MNPHDAEQVAARQLGVLARGSAFRLLGPLMDGLGPVALLHLGTEGGRGESPALGMILLDGMRAEFCLRPVPRRVVTVNAARGSDPAEPQWEDPLSTAGLGGWTDRSWVQDLAGRTLIAHGTDRVSKALATGLHQSPDSSLMLDTSDLLMVTHPDLLDLEFASWVLRVLNREARPGAAEAVLDLLSCLIAIAAGARSGEQRYACARDALERYSPHSPWLALLRGSRGFEEGVETEDNASQMLKITDSHEEPVPFEVEAIASVLRDEARGARYFPGYRVREEQLTLMRGFFENLQGGGTLLLEGGTGVGKSLAYLAAVIPFATARSEAGARDPVVISTRTKLLQDQLLEKDIAAAARMLGHSQLRALSIKGRANYVCEWRLQDTLASGSDSSLLAEDALAHSVLLSCARIRSGGEVGSLPGEMFSRQPRLRDLIQGSVARRSEQCTREQCAHQRRCPFGRRRLAMARADLVVANHDLLLRWPPDYPRFRHVIIDEAHELAEVADEVYAQVVRPDELRERIDEIFGVQSAAAQRGAYERALLPQKQQLEAARFVSAARRDLALDLAAVGRGVATAAGAYGEVELPADASRHFPEVAQTADLAADRLDEIGRFAEELDARAEWNSEDRPEAGEGPSAVQKNAQALYSAAAGLRRAFSESGEEAVAVFDRLVVPYDRWTLAIRAVSPADDFHERFMGSLDSFAGVSASLFVGGDSFAAMGELEIEERGQFGIDKITAPSPFDYAENMRVAALRTEPGPIDLVADTTEVIAGLARQLSGRTMGLFSSLRRMREVADRLEDLLLPDSIEVLAARRSGDDPGGLVRRFRESSGGRVLLGSRTFWQGLDIAGDDLQAVVIEKLPFEVPTELRRRREARIEEFGQNAFERYRLGKMLLNLKQMTGRLIRGEGDRGLVVIVEGRTDRGYFQQLDAALPAHVGVRVVEASVLPDLLSELGLGETGPNGRSSRNR